MFTAEVTELVFVAATAQSFLAWKRCCVSNYLTPLSPAVLVKLADFAMGVATALLPGGVS